MDETTPPTVRVLLINADEEVYHLVRHWLAEATDAHFSVNWVAAASSGRSALRRDDYDVCLLDCRLEESRGLDLLRETPVEDRGRFILLLADQGAAEVELAATQSGVADCIRQGELTPSLFWRAIRHTLERQRLLLRTREESAARRRAETALGAVVSQARCLLWQAEVEDQGGDQLGWRVQIFDEEAAQRFLPLVTSASLTYSGAWYRSRVPEDRDRTDAYGQSQVRAGRNYHQEFRCRDRDGVVHWLAEKVRVETVSPGRWRVVGVCTDITEMREAVQARLESHAILKAVTDGAADAIYVKDRDGRYLMINPAGARFVGRSVDEIIGARDTDLFSAEAAAGTAEADQRVLATGETFTDEDTLDAAGVTRTYHSTKAPMVDAHGNVIGVIGISRDISARMQAELALRESEARFRTIADCSPLGIFLTSAGGATIYQNREMLRQLGQQQPQLEYAWAKAIHPEDRAAVDAAWHSAFSAAAPLNCVNRYRHPDGTVLWASVHAAPVLDEGMLTGYVGVSEDITARREAEEVLRLRDAAIHALPVGLLITAVAGATYPIIYANPASAEITGYSIEEILGQSPGFLEGPDTDPETITRIHEAVRLGEPLQCEMLNRRKDGTSFWNALSISPIRDAEGRLTHFVGIQHDVTQRRNLEEQLRQGQKMEAVGRLAGGVAHDFNNMLAVISGYASLLLPRATGDPPLLTGLAEIAKAADRAAGLTRQLLAFSRKQVLEPKVLDLRDTVADMERMLGRLIGEDIDLLVIAEPTLGTVRADPGQIEQCILNLAVNARDAMPRGGRVTLELKNAEMDQTYARQHLDVLAGQYVTLTLSDTGCGMSAEVAARVFEPFFTTKGDKGTGLGLATVYGIVKQSGGHLSVYSEPGHGASFRLWFPRLDTETAVQEKTETSLPLGGGETVLLCEDEAMVRQLVRTVLEMQGYAVLDASDGASAVRAAAAHPGPIHLLLTDVVMPGGMSGKDVAEQISALRPDMKTLFMSGYTDDAIVHHGVLEAGTAFIHKPFVPSALARKVREVLD